MSITCRLDHIYPSKSDIQREQWFIMDRDDNDNSKYKIDFVHIEFSKEWWSKEGSIHELEEMALCEYKKRISQ